MIYSMKETCLAVGMSYETLKFYCREGLVPNVQRDKLNHRVFDEQDVAWLKGLQCLKRCGMGIKEMRRYMELCLEGISSIPERKEMLDEKRELLLIQRSEIDESLAYIEKKQALYDDILAGKKPYTTNLRPREIPLKEVSDAG